MAKQYDIRITDVKLVFLSVDTRVPLKFGSEILTSVTCARASVCVENENGKFGEGVGETPLSVQWVWPSVISYEERHEALISFSELLVPFCKSIHGSGHAIELGHSLVFEKLP